MYDDSGSWKLFFNFLNCLYKEHPVKKEIAGTVESISHITPEYLYKCYDTFYNLSNMSIVVVGYTFLITIDWFPEDGAQYPVRVFLYKDEVMVTLDTSGDSLQREDTVWQRARRR